MNQKIDKQATLAKLSLGKTTQYLETYSPNLLQAVPRSMNRVELNLTTELPFTGIDRWNGYELSWLNPKGKPVVAVAEFRFACTSPNLVESKSFKLYLNSFNQSQFSSVEQVEKILTQDLSATAGAQAKVSLFNVDHCPALAIKSANNAICIDDEDISVNNYQYQGALLAQAQVNSSKDVVEEHLVSHLLKSNCLITNQPDWASIYINYKGVAINHSVLLAYLISFRQHNEFHEQCVERICCDIMAQCKTSKLSVYARYTR